MCDIGSHCFTCNELKAVTHTFNMSLSMSDFGKVEVLTSSNTTNCISTNAIKLLCYFSSCVGEIKRRDEIESHVWATKEVSINALPVLMHELRKILANTEYSIITVRGAGYMMTRRDYNMPLTSFQE
ncbi:helix-turn-helix domain-containing protein [Vibrio brasiliensis]|uniref:helix-turn-helix domain-containing protein n=1 Tax=Vibrio brasiliensis TaxID=170652 RepID=UPI003CE46337